MRNFSWMAGVLAAVFVMGGAAAQTPTSSDKPPTTAPAPSAAPAEKVGAPVKPAATPAKAELIDINTATAAELDTLPGIGKARAEKIIKGRPYRVKSQLVGKRILPKRIYDPIKDRITAKQG